ncbi:unnamed protein product [Tenebrio molitor]|nr:unnamed protein product [Tenebrio molitor]
MVILTILTISAINFTDLLRKYFLIFIVFDDYLSSELSSVLSFVTLKIVLITILFMFLCIPLYDEYEDTVLCFGQTLFERRTRWR